MSLLQKSFLLLLSLLLSFVCLSQGQAEVVTVLSDVSKGVQILKGLDGLFSKTKHRMTDITPPGLHFDMLDDKSYCQLLQGMKMSEFTSIVTEIVESEFQDPDGMKKKVLRGKFAPKNRMTVNRFTFEKGIGGSAMFGFIATMRQSDETFDLAICTQELKFKLAPRRILNEVKQSSLFSSSKSQYITFEEMSLSQAQKEEIEQYLNYRIFTRFESDFRYMIGGPTGQEAISYCKADQAEDCY